MCSCFSPSSSSCSRVGHATQDQRFFWRFSPRWNWNSSGASAHGIFDAKAAVVTALMRDNSGLILSRWISDSFDSSAITLEGISGREFYQIIKWTQMWRVNRTDWNDRTDFPSLSSFQRRKRTVDVNAAVEERKTHENHRSFVFFFCVRSECCSMLHCFVLYCLKEIEACHLFIFIVMNFGLV